jgi:uncharacterized protein (TIGR02145 family)
MKKIYFIFLLLSLWGLGGLFGNFAFAQVSVKLIGETYTVPPQVSFTVSWESKAPYNNKIWVLAQYSASGIAEERALITDVIATGAATASTSIAANYRGFWLHTDGSINGSATVTATLSIADGVEKFNWCVYAFDYPPNAVLQADETYQLHGSPPFTINGNISEPTNTFGPGTCITSITDATDNPEGHIIAALFLISAGAINDASDTTFVGYAPATMPTNAMEASGGDGNMMYEWRRTGTSSATLTNSNSSEYDISDDATNYDTPGTYYFTRYAKYGTCSTTFTPSGGQYMLWVIPMPPGAGTQTWTTCSQIWSGYVRIEACDKESWTYAATSPYCRSNTWNNIKFYYYNWTYLNTYQSIMCPSPWHAPKRNDLSTLLGCLGNTTSINVYYPTSSTWGGELCGYISQNTFIHQGNYTTLWSSEQYNANDGYRMQARYDDIDIGIYHDLKGNGYAVRCLL